MILCANIHDITSTASANTHLQVCFGGSRYYLLRTDTWTAFGNTLSSIHPPRFGFAIKEEDINLLVESVHPLIPNALWWHRITFMCWYLLPLSFCESRVSALYFPRNVNDLSDHGITWKYVNKNVKILRASMLSLYYVQYCWNYNWENVQLLNFCYVIHINYIRFWQAVYNDIPAMILIYDT